MTESSHSGRCHCGALQFEYKTSTEPERWPLRACQCRFCRMHDAISTSDPGGELAFYCDDPALLCRYRFAMKTADFLLCHRCGVYVGAVIATDTGRYGIINTRALDNRPAATNEIVPISYEGEGAHDRVQRREQRWTPVSELPF